MSDTTNEVQNLPEDEYDEMPQKTSKKKKEKKAKKKGGVLGKILCLLLGFFLGILSVIGAVAGGAYYVATRPLDDTINTVDNITGADLYATFFGSTDENGEYSAGLLNKKYAEATVGDLLGDVGEAIGNLSSEDASLAALNEISPKVGSTVDGLVKTIAEYGIPLDTETLLNTPFKGENGIMEYVKNSLKDIAAGDLLKTLSGQELSPLFRSICYGKENEDYVIDEDGNVTMLGDAKKKTIGELTNFELSTLFDDILLVDVMGLEENYDSKIVMRLLYGKEGVNYRKIDTDGDGVKDGVEMLYKEIYVKKDDFSVIYDENNEIVAGASYTEDGDVCTYTDADGNTFTCKRAGSKTLSNGVKVYVRQLPDVKYSPTSIGDLMGETNIIDNLINTLTIAEVFEDELLDSNVFLKHVKDETIESLPGAIAKLTVVDVYEDEVYKEDGVTLKGSWKYLLTDKDTGEVDETITVTDMQKMIDNMQANIHQATLNELKADAILDLDPVMLNTQIKTSVYGVSLECTFPGKTKLGQLTVEEMLTYVNEIMLLIN